MTSSNLLKNQQQHIKKTDYLIALVLALVIACGSFIILRQKPENQINVVTNIALEKKPRELAAKVAAVETANAESKMLLHEVKRGDSLGSILGKLRTETPEIHQIVQATNKVFKTSKLKVGDKIYVHYDELADNQENKKIQVNKLKIYSSETEKYEVARNNLGEFHARQEAIELYSKLQVKSGKITSSLYQDAIDAGIPPALIMEFIRFYSFDLDFQRDIRKGDKFQIFYETFYNSEGQFIKNGDIIFCKFITGGKEYANYKYTTTKGSTLYFDQSGSSVKKSLLRTPISGARISSSFGYRKHPILGYNKLHTGVDFAARTGTPIFAAGNGTVTRIGWNGGYGRYIKIRHNSRYSTAYAHMSRFGKGLKVGSKVKQRQVIGYVGSTGRSTGPHLHYEVLVRGKAVNPRSIRAESKVALKGKELDKFQIHRARIDFILTNAFAEANIE